MEGVATTGMEAIVSAVSALMTASVGWVGDIAGTIVEQPLLLATFGVGFIGFSIGMFKRLKG